MADEIVYKKVTRKAARIKHNAFLTDRVKTDNRSVMNNIAAINDQFRGYMDKIREMY